MSYSVQGVSPSLNPSGKTGSFYVRTNPAPSYRQAPAKKKKLNYNPREISAQIIRAAKSTAAGQVLVRAKGKTAQLQRQLVSGQYDETEVRRALAHAKRMVKCARTKVNNLREEEGDKKRGEKAGQEAERNKKREIRRRVETKKQKLRKEAQREFESMKRAQQKKAEDALLQQKRRRHRDEEREELFEAEIKYLQGDTGDEMPRTPVYETAAAVFAMSEQMAGLEMQLQQLARAEAEIEMQQETEAAPQAGMPAADAALSGADADAAGQAVSIDISL